jgi:hypothetical protein
LLTGWLKNAIINVRGEFCFDLNPTELTMQEVTIAGEVFKIAPRYKEGDALSENEAAALNQTYFENIRNNMAKKVSDAKEGDKFDFDDFQSEVTKYANEYEFGARRAAVPRDPIMAEAVKLARNAVKNAIISTKGAEAAAATPADEINRLATNLVNARPKYLTLAKEIVEARKGVTDDILLDIGQSAA